MRIIFLTCFSFNALTANATEVYVFPVPAGPTANNGCPWPDADLDGIPNKDDACPQLAGPVSNNGCPVIPDSIIAELNKESSMIRL